MATVAEVRRAVNDSGIGQFVNGSLPGILVEGLSRTISDTASELKYFGIGKVAEAMARGAPLRSLALSYSAAMGVIADFAEELDPSGHYSHTSRLWTINDGKMIRVPTSAALVWKIAENFPNAAAGLFSRFEESYR